MKFQIRIMLSHASEPEVDVKSFELKYQFEASNMNTAITKAKNIVKSYYGRYLDAKVFAFNAELYYVRPVWRTRFQGRDRSSVSKAPKANRSQFLEERLHLE